MRLLLRACFSCTLNPGIVRAAQRESQVLCCISFHLSKLYSGSTIFNAGKFRLTNARQA
jgi:hypothetical protein